jgi:pimeloyl-ACP methyl ester carboxylesterase
MAEFILVHGAWHGAWCWREVVARLEARGHTATAIDLPGHGEDCSPPEKVTLQDYVTCIVNALAHSSHRPLVVGHSMGGLIGQVAELVPDRIRALVYVSALLAPSGTSMMQLVAGFDPQYLAEFEWAPDRRTARLSAAGLRNFLYSCCPADLVEAAFPLLTPEPVAPYETPFATTDANFGRVPRYYVECLRDRIVPLALQRSMRAGLTFRDIYSIDIDHAPFFSAPDELTGILHTIAEQA